MKKMKKRKPVRKKRTAKKRPWRLHVGDCLDVMCGMLDESVTAIVTDPPYGLGFMGKGWDHGVPGVAYWEEALRVVKPGGMLLAFGGTRTHHRLMSAIEDAGWEIRDCLMWLYGTGFPKSLDVSKAIDGRRADKDIVRVWLKSLGSREEVAAAAKVTPRQVDHWLGENTPCPQTLTERRFVLLCQHFGSVPSWADEMFKKVGKKLGTITHARSGGDDFAKVPGSRANAKTVDHNALATDAAKLWQGYGTALKPAWEPIIVAMKPLDGTFAQNALAHGVAGVNVDGCRVGGRWPANVALGEDAAAMLDEQTEGKLHGAGAARAGSSNPRRENYDASSYMINRSTGDMHRFGDSGGASRFFYVAKAAKKERTAGGRVENKHPTVKPVELMRWLIRLVKMPKGSVILDPFVGSGSTGVAAILEGVRCVLIEKDEESAEVARARLQIAVQER